ncbi:MAG: EAL domain-containing protein [Coprobacillus sp.]
MAVKRPDILKDIHHNMLLGLADNSSFYECLKAITEQNEVWSIMTFSIDDFKHFNDMFSYSFGNKILDSFADEIMSTLPIDVELFRLDGNSFGIIAYNTSDFLTDLYLKINDLAHSSRNIDGLDISFSISAGICEYPKDGDNHDILYRNSRIALSYAKKKIQNKFVYYQEEMAEKEERDMILLEDLRYSIDHNFEGFSLVYQPIVYAKDKTLFGCEALLRYRSPSFTEGLSPFVFIPILENSGLILEVGKWIIDTAFQQCAIWRKMMPDFEMNINVSARQFDQDDFPDYVLSTLHKHNLNPQAITLELTESEPAQFEFVNKAFYILRKHGIKTAFDDFGTGYASLDIFRSISGDELKIDRSFLERITYDVTDQILLQYIIEMCHTMNIKSCIEGIENTETENIISQLNPDLLQGYLYSRPISSQEFEDKFLKDIISLEKHSIQDSENRSAFAYTELRPAKPMSMSAIGDNAYAGIIQVGMDDNFTLLSCNEGYRRMLGYSAKEIEEKFGNQALGFVHVDDIQWVNAEVRRQLGMGDTLHSEFRITKKDGSSLWVFGSGNVAYSQDGNPSLIVVIMDIDEEKKKQLREIENHKLYNEVIENIPNGVICTKDNDTLEIEYLSPSFLTLIGYTEIEIKNNFSNQLSQLIIREDYKEFIEDLHSQKNQDNFINLLFKIPCKDNSLIRVEALVSQITNSHSSESKLCFSIVNATEVSAPIQKKTQIMKHLYQQANQRFEDVNFEYNFHTNCAMVSKSFETMFGYELPDDNIISLDIILSKNTDLFNEAVEIIQMSGYCDPIKIHMTRSDQTKIWCEVFLTARDHSNRENSIIDGKIVNIDYQYKEDMKSQSSQYDKLTRLINKATSEKLISLLLKNNPDRYFALFILDVNNFSEINNTYGHYIGDIVLKTVSLRLKNMFRESDIIGRIGGDEFIIFMKFNNDYQVIEERCNLLMEYVCSPIKINNFEPFNIDISIGVSTTQSENTTFAHLFSLADRAMYRVKKSKHLNYSITD